MKRPGYNYDLGPRGEHYNEEWVPPVFLEEPETLPGQVKARAQFLGGYLNASDRLGTDWLGSQLLKWSTDREHDADLGYIESLDSTAVETLRDYGMRLQEGPFGIWYTVDAYEDAIEVAQADIEGGPADT